MRIETHLYFEIHFFRCFHSKKEKNLQSKNYSHQMTNKIKSSILCYKIEIVFSYFSSNSGCLTLGEMEHFELSLQTMVSVEVVFILIEQLSKSKQNVIVKSRAFFTFIGFCLCIRTHLRFHFLRV